MNEQDDLIGDMIAEIARSHGVPISRGDPIVAVVLLNQLVLRHYLEETLAPVAGAIRDATKDAVRQIEQFAEAQATWLEQVLLKDRALVLEEQKAPRMQDTAGLGVRGLWSRAVVRGDSARLFILADC